MFFLHGVLYNLGHFCCTGSFARKVTKNITSFLNWKYDLKSENCIRKPDKYNFFLWMRGYSSCCKIASNLLFINGRKFYHFISVSVLLYIPTLLLSLPCLPPTHPTMCYLVCIFVRYSFKSNITVKISFFVCLFLIMK